MLPRTRLEQDPDAVSDALTRRSPFAHMTCNNIYVDTAGSALKHQLADKAHAGMGPRGNDWLPAFSGALRRSLRQIDSTGVLLPPYLRSAG